VKILPAYSGLNNRGGLFNADPLPAFQSCSDFGIAISTRHLFLSVRIFRADDSPTIKNNILRIFFRRPPLHVFNFCRDLRALPFVPPASDVCRFQCLRINPVDHDMDVDVVSVRMRSPDDLVTAKPEMVNKRVHSLAHLRR
jgi:hypothetical protein